MFSLNLETILILTEWAWISSNVVYLFVPFSTTLQQLTAYGKMLEQHKKTAWTIHAKYLLSSAYPAGLLVLLLTTFYLGANGSQTYWAWTLLFFFQLSRRAYESIFIHSYSEKWALIIQLPAAWWFYTQVILGMASTLALNPSRIAPLQALLAAVVFLFGSYHQHRCHVILRDLRSNPSVRYAIPYGDWFEYVSAPHYLAEILIYTSFVILAPHLLMPWLILLFVVLNLGVTAHGTHKWYQEKFNNYPKHRKAMIPFLY